MPHAALRLEFAGLLIEGQDCCGVDVEDVAHTGKQFDQQGLGTKVAQRAIGERVELVQPLGATKIVGGRRLHARRMP